MSYSDSGTWSPRETRRGSQVNGYASAPRGVPYRRDSNMSDASFVSDVEMAHDEVFAGPMSESVPTSITSFAHRRSRAGSTASFTYLQETEDQIPSSSEEAVVEDGEEFDEPDYGEAEAELDLEAGELSPLRRKSSAFSRSSVEHPLLDRLDSAHSDLSLYEHDGGRTTQKMYISSEDLTIVIAGFSTRFFGSALYVFICVLTAGIGYLVFRWVPRWRVALVGTRTPLRRCSWVVIENQWREMSIVPVRKERYERVLSTVFGSQEKLRRRLQEEEDDDPVLTYLRSLDYRYVRFCFHPLRDKFVVNNTWKDPAWTNVKTIRSGIDSDEKSSRELVFGSNAIEIEQKTIPQLLVDEAFHPFYIFQLASLMLWSLDEYYYYAVCILFISLVSITTTLIETRATMKRLREISRYECDVRVKRNGFWRHLPSSELVPGDIFEVSDPSLDQFPCDSLLLSGDCIVNESMLTGESVPVTKLPATDDALARLSLAAATVPADIAKHFLFCGTKIIRARRPHDQDEDEAIVLAMVLRIGFNTTKGALVRSMLFPKPSGFKFYRDSFRYISVMACIAILGFIASFVNFVRLKLAWHLIIVRALDLITIVVPPALPATLTIGTNFAIQRLKKKQIFCISPQRVNVGGKLDVICFDKTGTLTEDGLDILGVRVVEKSGNRFSEVLNDSHSLLPGSMYERDPTIDYAHHKAALNTMATCHSLRVVDDELLGDPLDVKMFEFTNWSFDEGEQKLPFDDDADQSTLVPPVARPPNGMEFELDSSSGGSPTPVELGVLKSFEFISQLRRASVVVRRFGSVDVDIYVKGAPECMRDICRPESFPPDYEDLLSYYTHRGFRVIACATKHMTKMNWVKVQKFTRSQAESELDFIGFIIFENKLKPTTADTINELREANIRKIMCTGDNILTAISVGRECDLIDRSAHCFVPHFIEGDAQSPKARIRWESVDNPLFQLDEHSLQPLPPPAEEDASLPYDITNLKSYSIAVTGDVFRWIVDYAPTEKLNRMLVKGQIFARMSPDEKHELVEKLQSIDYCCGFCGDGANDCGALKAADVGISLSEAEASVAAPFTSRVFDISCVPEVIREGRAALVTSFSCFKYMSLYSAIQFTSVSFLYASASNLGDFQFLYIDIVLILPIAIFMGLSGAYHKISPKRPTANLVSRKVLTPLLGQIVLVIIIQMISFESVQRQPWFIPPKLNLEKSNIKNSENTTLFLVSCYQYILAGVVLSIGPPFRQSMTDNVPFVVTIVVTLILSTYMLFDPAVWLQKFMQLTDMSINFRILLVVLVLGGFGCSWVAEKHVLPVLAKYLGKARQRFLPKSGKKRKAYKLLLEEMRT